MERLEGSNRREVGTLGVLKVAFEIDSDTILEGFSALQCICFELFMVVRPPV